MKPFYLVETVTKDKFIHQGIFFKPTKPRQHALLWVHGLTSTFYSGITALNELINQCETYGFGFASFNNRGHDFLTGIRKVDRRKPKGYANMTGGAGIEQFKDCVFDIDAAITFLVSQGFSEIILVGHSSGANKVSYYAGSKKDKRVTGVILASPTSDRLNVSDKHKLEKDLQFMQDLVNKDEGIELQTGFHFFPITPYRFLSLFTSNSLEDQFDYGDPRPRMTYFSKIKKPLLVLIGEKDESLDRSAKKALEVFDSYQHSTNYKSIIINDGLHSFNGKEKEVAKKVVDWITSIK